MMSVPVTRRDFLSATLLLPTLARQTSEARASSARCRSAIPAAFRAAVRPAPRRRPRRAAVHGSLRNPQSAIHNPQCRRRTFFVRTAFPSTLAAPTRGRSASADSSKTPLELSLRELEPLVAPGGRYLIECSGNADQTNYGLMSAADWEGVPLAAILDRARPSAASYRVLVSGVDDEGRRRGRRCRARAGSSRATICSARCWRSA